jgi:hypothetical protein
MTRPFGIKLSISKVKVVSDLNPSHQMFHGILYDVLRNLYLKSWVVPQNSLFSKIKKQNKQNKGWQRGESRLENQAAIFGENSRPNCTSLCPKIERKCKFKVKLNYYWTNLHKN